MAQSFSVNDSTGRYTLTLTLTEGTQSVANNQTPLTYKLVLYALTNYNFELYKIGRTVTLNGTTVYNVARTASASLSIADKGSLTLAEGSTTITHNADGTKSISVAFSIDMKKVDYTPGAMSGTGTMALTTIPRATQPTLSPSSVTMGNTMTINLPSTASSFTHDVSYSFGNLSNVTIQTGAATSASWPVRIDLASQIPKSPSGTGTITVVTKNNGSVIGTKTASFTAIVPKDENTKPKAEFTISPTNNPSWVKVYVQGKTKVSAKAIEETIKYQYGTELKSYNLYADGVNYSNTSNPIESNLLNKSGEVLVKASVTDKRGFTSVAHQETIMVYPYAKPSIVNHSVYKSIVCGRCDDNGNPDNSGTNLLVRMRFKWSSLSNGENEPTIGYTVGKYSGTIQVTASGGGEANNYTSWYDINQKIDNVTLEKKNSYVATITITDKYDAFDTLTFQIPTEDVAFHLGEKGNKAAFGKYAVHDNTLEIAEDWSLMLNGEVVGDFPISRYTSAISALGPRAAGTWHITKWKSGLVELHARVGFSKVAVTGAWGTMYSGNVMNSNIPYPVTFKTVPMCQVTPEFSLGGNYWLSVCDHTGAETTTPMYQAVRPTSSTVTVILNYYVRGYIKED